MQIGNLNFNIAFPAFLAPMAGVTDLPFRLLCKAQGCDMTCTEMVSAKGLYYGGSRTEELLCIGEAERPCAVQLFGNDPDIMADMAKQVLEEHGHEIAIIDMNMGCPAPKITGNGEGSALMRNLPLAGKIIQAVAAAAAPWPVTVKFRKGWDENSVNAVAFGRMAQENGAAAVAVHGRTRMQGYSGKADWDIIGEVKAALHIPVLGNGDVFSGQDALRLQAHTSCDGVLVARGAQGNPWIFREIRAAVTGEKYEPPTIEERAAMALAHARMQQAYKGQHGLVEMRKHLAWYLKGARGAAKLRARANACNTLEQIQSLLQEFLQKEGEGF